VPMIYWKFSIIVTALPFWSCKLFFSSVILFTSASRSTIITVNF